MEPCGSSVTGFIALNQALINRQQRVMRKGINLHDGVFEGWDGSGFIILQELDADCLLIATDGLITVIRSTRSRFDIHRGGNRCYWCGDGLVFCSGICFGIARNCRDKASLLAGYGIERGVDSRN